MWECEFVKISVSYTQCKEPCTWQVENDLGIVIWQWSTYSCTLLHQLCCWVVGLLQLSPPLRHVSCDCAMRKNKKFCRKDTKREMIFLCRILSFPFLYLLSTYCCFHLHQIRSNWFTTTYTFLQARYPRCFNRLGVILWWLDVTLILEKLHIFIQLKHVCFYSIWMCMYVCKNWFVHISWNCFMVWNFIL